MRRFLLLLLLVTGSWGIGNAQKIIDEHSTWSFRDRAYTGLGIGGISFGTRQFYGNFFSAGASVLEGYMLTKNLSVGIGFEYQYTSYSQIKAKSHMYGGYPFIRYNIKNFFIQADYDKYNVKMDFRSQTDTEKLADRLLIGVGYFGMGERASTNFLVSYDFLYTNAGPWGTPLNTRFFFTF